MELKVIYNEYFFLFFQHGIEWLETTEEQQQREENSLLLDISDLEINDEIVINGNHYQIKEKNENTIVVSVVPDAE